MDHETRIVMLDFAHMTLIVTEGSGCLPWPFLDAVEHTRP